MPVCDRAPLLRRALKRVIPHPDGTLEWQGKTLINLSSNDYLGLRHHPHLKAGAIAYIEKYGVGVGSSRLVSGNHPYHEHLEERLARMTGYEAALILNTGYQANLTILAALAERDTLLLLDHNCHNSLIEGARLSGAEWHRFRHQDFEHLKRLLASPKKKVIVSESLFSMDGDFTDLDALEEIAREFGAELYVDDAHAVGVYGVQGLGLTAQRGIDYVLGTFGKAFGSFGAYLLCSHEARDFLIQRCKGLIYTTALPPMIVGAVEAALDLIPAMEEERRYLKELARTIRSDLTKCGYDIGHSTSHIIPVIVGSEEEALEMERELFEAGFFAPAIRPPTVPPGKSRIRLSLTAHRRDDAVDF